MKFKFNVGTNFVGSEVTAVIDIPDSELEGLNDLEKDAYISEYYLTEWVWDNIQSGYEEII